MISLLLSLRPAFSNREWRTLQYHLDFFWGGKKGLSGRIIEPKESQHDLAMNPKWSDWADQVDITNIEKIEMAPG